MMNRHFSFAVFLFLVPLSALDLNAASHHEREHLGGLEIEELMHVEVVSALSSPTSFQNTPAAVTILTGEEIVRSGARTIADALRLIPGINVAQLDGNKWNISIRGFNGRFSNKLLVLIDGRSVYTPLFSGTYWDIQDLLLEDIQRIEVIRGPGGATWGANAVNGVINVITRPAKPGSLVTIGGGTYNDAFAAVRVGGELSPASSYRIFAKTSHRDAMESLVAHPANDDWQLTTAGFRIDTSSQDGKDWMLQGGIYNGTAGRLDRPPTMSAPYRSFRNAEDEMSGGHILSSLKWPLEAPGSVIQVSSYADYSQRDTINLYEKRSTFDLEASHHFHSGHFLTITYGAGYRVTSDDLQGRDNLQTDKEEETDHIYGVFMQSEISALESRLDTTLGIRADHNEYTGFEYQPSIRTLYHALDQHAVWAGISRAVRTPSRAEESFRIWNRTLPEGTAAPGSPVTTVELTGSSSFESEELLGYELGYRFSPSKDLLIDLAGFFNQYDNLRSFELGTAGPDGATGRIVLPLNVRNGVEGHSQGSEVSIQFTPSRQMRIKAGYAYLDIDLEAEPGSSDTFHLSTEGSSPMHTAMLGAMINLAENLTWDTWIRYVDELPAAGIEAYTALDMRLGWNLSENTECALVGRNLLDGQHQEAGGDLLSEQPSEIPMSAYAQLTIRL